MKKIKSLMFITTVFFLIIGCNKDDETPSNPETETSTTEKSEVVGKWLVNSNGYKSFEFTGQRNYIIIKNTVAGRNATNSTSTTGNILYGTYKVIDKNTVELEKLGKITQLNFKDNEVSFSFNAKKIKGKKTEAVKNSTKTDLLCQKWKLIKITNNGVTVNKFNGSTVLFTKHKTYFMDNVKYGYSVNNWEWKDSGQNTITYKKDEHQTGMPVGTLEIESVSKNSLKLKERTAIYHLELSK